MPRRGEPFWPFPDQVEDCRERSRAAIAYLREHRVDVVGDVEHLRVPDEPARAPYAGQRHRRRGRRRRHGAGRHPARRRAGTAHGGAGGERQPALRTVAVA
ncbi:hypothetical protein G5V59_08980 [Nocardioides sp. W3-2-3]|uniref:hypothetical protein n=1 Tax=Nocardioides convexus TaxID=2712224 RepID=UPI0024181F8A|nr:hypothetical protein [Nocardioides convexus]NHA00219.1 hypothetical protein [Nocardioides convexus]